jgi:hypothetical protein
MNVVRPSQYTVAVCIKIVLCGFLETLAAFGKNVQIKIKKKKILFVKIFC